MRYLVFILVVLVGCTSPDYEEQNVIDSLQDVGPLYYYEVQVHLATLDPEHNVPIICGKKEGQCGVDTCRCKCHGNLH